MEDLQRNVPLAVQVAARFRRLIETGAWPVGGRIPGEHELAQELEVSRGTVREALRALSMAGLIEPRVGDGTYVRVADELASVLSRTPSESLDDVLDVRAALERAAARRAPTVRSLQSVNELQAALRSRHRANLRGDVSSYVAADTRFHRALVAAAGNPLLTRIYDALGEVIVGAIQATTTLPEDPDLGALHEELADAVRSGDVARSLRACEALHDAVRRGDDALCHAAPRTISQSG